MKGSRECQGFLLLLPSVSVPGAGAEWSGDPEGMVYGSLIVGESIARRLRVVLWRFLC